MADGLLGPARQKWGVRLWGHWALPGPRAHYRPAFSASAIHWVDPDVSWRKVADLLVDGGTLGLISYFGLQELRSAQDHQALQTAMAKIAPKLAAA
jgi:hypothetical protein